MDAQDCALTGHAHATFKGGACINCSRRWNSGPRRESRHISRRQSRTVSAFCHCSAAYGYSRSSRDRGSLSDTGRARNPRGASSLDWTRREVCTDSGHAEEVAAGCAVFYGLLVDDGDGLMGGTVDSGWSFGQRRSFRSGAIGSAGNQEDAVRAGSIAGAARCFSDRRRSCDGWRGRARSESSAGRDSESGCKARRPDRDVDCPVHCRDLCLGRKCVVEQRSSRLRKQSLQTAEVERGTWPAGHPYLGPDGSRLAQAAAGGGSRSSPGRSTILFRITAI